MIVGFIIENIKSKRVKNIPKTRIDINSVPVLKSVKEIESPSFRKEKTIEIGFDFITKYNPNIAEIKVNGYIIYTGENVNEQLEIWKKDKKILEEIEIETKNFLLRKCLNLEIRLSEEMQLPPPIMFPRVIPKRKTNDENLSYIG